MASSRLFVSASSEGLNRSTSCPVTTYPLSIAGWAKVSDAGAIEHSLVMICDASLTGDYWNIFVLNDELYAYERDAASNASAQMGTVPDNTWFHFCGVFSNATSRAIYLNGSKTANTDTSTTPDDIDRIGLGYACDSSPGTYMDGNLYMIGVWSSTLSDANVTSLAGGSLPSAVDSGNLVASYFTGAESDNDQTGTYHMENTIGTPEWDSGDIPAVFSSSNAPTGNINGPFAGPLRGVI